MQSNAKNSSVQNYNQGTKRKRTYSMLGQQDDDDDSKDRDAMNLDDFHENRYQQPPHKKMRFDDGRNACQAQMNPKDNARQCMFRL